MRRLICVLLLCAGLTQGFAQAVKLVYDKSSQQVSYAARRLESALKRKRYAIRTSPFGYEIDLHIDKSLGKEAYNIAPTGKKITITGGDNSGLIYGALSVAEDLGNDIK